jgi:hypothetical protein
VNEMFADTFEENVTLTMGTTICPVVLDALVLVPVVTERERLFGGCVLLGTVTFAIVVLTDEDTFDETLLLTVDDEKVNAVRIEVVLFVVLLSDGSGVAAVNELLLLFNRDRVVLMKEGRLGPPVVPLLIALTVFTSVRLKVLVGSPVNGLTVALPSIDAFRGVVVAMLGLVVVFGKMVPLNGR